MIARRKDRKTSLIRVWAKESGGYGWLDADDAGRILIGRRQGSSVARGIFRLQWITPAPLRDWLKRRVSEMVDSNAGNLSARQFSIRRGSKRLIVRSLSRPQEKKHRLVLSEITEALDPGPLQNLGLTNREAEVLLWVSQGKRNAEIATILGTTSKTHHQTFGTHLR